MPSGRAVAAGLGLWVVAGCAHAGAGGPGPAALPPAGQSQDVPAGTLTMVELREPLSTERSRPGDRFTAVLLDPLVDQQGREVAPRGAALEGQVAGRDSGDLQLRILALRREDEPPVPFPAEVAHAPTERPSGFRRGVLGALAGAAAGAGAGLAADSQSGAVVGGASVVGAGVGALVGWLLRGRGQAALPAGSSLTLRLTEPFGSRLARREPEPPRYEPGMRRPGAPGEVEEGPRVPAALPERAPGADPEPGPVPEEEAP